MAWGNGEPRRTRHARCAIRGLAVVALAAAIAFGPAAAAPAPERQLLLQADEITYDTNAGTVNARGHVQVSSGTRTLMADELSYDEKADKVIASGKVSIQETGGNVAFADRVELTQDLREGALQGLAALIGDNGQIGRAHV
mgnify:FL=1